MSDVKLVISLDENKYRQITTMPNVYGSEICEAIRNSTPYNPSGDLISREALEKSMRKSINERYKHWDKPITVADIATLIFDEIDNATTVPQVTVFTENADETAIEDMKAELQNVLDSNRPKGEWLESDIPESVLAKCSICCFDCGAYTHNFCPNCGADMRGKEE